MERRGFFQTGPWFDLSNLEPTTPQDVSLLCVSRRAMATLFEILLPEGGTFATVAANEALDLVDELEAQLTVYRDDSEVSRINATASTGPIPVEENLFALFERAAVLTRETQGAFDIAMGALIKAWGFYHRQGRIPEVSERIAAMNRSGMRYVLLDASARTIRFLRAGLEINLGAIGKGYALDRVAAYLRSSWNQRAALLHGGSSSVLALGHPPGNPRGWPVALKHPWKPDQRLGVVHLRDQALGTSAATHQHFEYNGRTFGHLLDPRTGWPAETVQQVSVIAPTAAEADALSTALYVMGFDAARRYCLTHPAVHAIILPSNPDAEPVVLNTILAPEF